MPSSTRHWTFWLKACLWPLLLLPLARLGYGLWSDLSGRGTLLLTANPVEFMIRQSGYWGLSFLLLGLTLTPLGRLGQLNGLIRVRRLVGLFAFAYLCMHLLLYVWLEQGLILQDVWKDILDRPFILLGMTSWGLLLPLAISSNQWSQKKLGGKRWQQLHRLAYIAPILGVLHYEMLTKVSLWTPKVFAVLLTLLLGWRLWRKLSLQRPAKFR